MKSADLAEVFPPSPRSPPPRLTEPSKAYRRHAWLALAGLIGFVGLYLGMLGYLAWLVYRLLGGTILHGGSALGAIFSSLPALFFLAFLVSGLFIVKHGKEPSLNELTPDQEPLLFAFLHRLADETGAPRPHKIFVSGGVNASVFYDLSFWNLLFPSKKNLNIGLGLVNTLSLDELKAVLAHEYGHFAQRTMAVGRWVYIAEQIAGNVVMSRGAFDKFLAGLSSIDLRIAWIGWILRLFVWAIRALFDTAFAVVVIAHRALGREMEFQADRVAVSVSGSDSLVHALHRLGPADEAWEAAISFAVEEVQEGREIDDLFTLQTASLEHLRRILDEPNFGRTPKRPANAQSHRVFDAKLAQPPRMWLTHPPNRDREESAKAEYLPSALDEREAWVLFRDPPSLRRSVTKVMFESVKRPEKVKSAEGTTLERLAKRFSRIAFDPKYRGVYLGRSIAAYDAKVSALFGSINARDRNEVLAALDQLYPAALRSDLANYRERREEETLLAGLSDGVLTAPGGVIRYRGRELRKKELPRVIESVRAERREVENRILKHDRSCRATHLAAAKLVGNSWAEHLEGLVELLHYSVHTFRNIADVFGYLHHVLGIVLADGRVSDAERQRVLAAGSDLERAISILHESYKKVVLPADVAKLVEEAGGLPVLAKGDQFYDPNEHNLGDWLQVADAYTPALLHELDILVDASLDALLEAEAKVAAALRDGGELEPAPARAQVSSKYATCTIGQERKRQKKLDWWDRFQTADGFVPGTMRAVVASVLLVPALLVGGRIGHATLHVMNGLSVPVVVHVQEQKLNVMPGGDGKLELEPSENIHLVTRTTDGRVIDELDGELGGAFSDAVYNVAQATAFVEWTAVYGPGRDIPPRPIGAPRWLNASQDHILRQPPTQVSLKAGQTEHRTVLQQTNSEPPESQLRLVSSAEEKQAIIAAHLRLEPLTAAAFGMWLGVAHELPNAREILLERAKENSGVVVLERALQDGATPEERSERCKQTHEAAARAPEDGNLAYLSLRCREPAERGENAWIELWEKHPTNVWLNWAAADELAKVARWRDSIQAFRLALSSPELTVLKNAGAAVEVLRIVRAAQAAGQVVPLPDILEKDPSLLFIQRMAGPEMADDLPMIKAYRALSKGDLDAAISARPPTDSGIVVFVGASDGAPEPLQQRALELEIDPSHESAHAMQIALKIRHKIAVEDPKQEELIKVLSDPALAKSPKHLQVLAAKKSPRERATIFAMGAIVLGDKAPAEWRRQAKMILFPFERPYFL